MFDVEMLSTEIVKIQPGNNWEWMRKTYRTHCGQNWGTNERTVWYKPWRREIGYLRKWSRLCSLEGETARWEINMRSGFARFQVFSDSKCSLIPQFKKHITYCISQLDAALHSVTPLWQNWYSRSMRRFATEYLQCYHISIHNIPSKFRRCCAFWSEI